MKKLIGRNEVTFSAVQPEAHFAPANQGCQLENHQAENVSERRILSTRNANK